MIARKNFRPAVAVDIKARHALGVLARSLAGAAGKNALGRPFLNLAGPRRDLGDEERAGVLARQKDRVRRDGRGDPADAAVALRPGASR